jgi:serine/threonine-protein kinase RsbW
LELENRPQNVALVRATLAGVAESARFEPELATSLRTAISEACNNVVVHAYEGASGPMAVEIKWTDDRVDVVVADSGSGIQRVSSAGDHMGLGLALISALSDQAEFRSPEAGGTEVRMRFRRDPQATEAGISRDGIWHTRTVELDGDVVLWCAPVSVLRHVLGRLTRAVAAGSHFTITGAESFHAINDAVSSYAERAADDHVVVAITAQARQLELDGGPFHCDIAGDGAGRGTAIASTVERRSLAELVDAISFEPLNGHGVLHLTIRDRGRAT